MPFFSISLRVRLGELLIAAALILFVWILQTDILSRFAFNGLVMNLPLTFTIVWATVFPSRLPTLTPENFRSMRVSEIALYQSLCGSLSGALVGAFFAALYASILPVYPIMYPIIGWISGYFNLRRINSAVLMCIPLVLFASVFGEFVNAVQLIAVGRPDILRSFMSIALPESILNALVAPMIFYPMNTWYEFWNAGEVAVSE